MVGGRGIALVGIDARHKLRRRILGQLLDDMHALVVLTFGVDDLDGLRLIAKYTAVAYLSTHLTIKWSIVEDELIELVLLLGNLAVAQDMTVVFSEVVAHELLHSRIARIACDLYPVAVLHSGGIAGTVFLLLHLRLELLLVDGKTVLTTDEFREVERETVSVEQAEGLYTVELRLTCSLQLLHGIIQHTDTFIERAKERLFLLLDHLTDELLLCLQLREGVTHLVDEGGEQTIEEALLLSEEGVGIADGTAQDTTDDIACLRIRRQLTVGYREGNGTQVVGTYAHGHIDIVLLLRDRVLGLFLKGGIFQSCDVLLRLDDRLEHVGIVVGVLTLHHTHEALEAHTCIDDVHRQRLQRAVGLAVELHEDDIPDLDDLWVVLVDKFTTALARGCSLFRGTTVDVDL